MYEPMSNPPVLGRVFVGIYAFCKFSARIIFTAPVVLVVVQLGVAI